VTVVRREDTTNIDLTKIGCKNVDWFHLAQDSYRWRPLVKINKTSVSIKDGEFIAQLTYYQHLKKDSVPWSYFIGVVYLSKCYIPNFMVEWLALLLRIREVPG
jgi:hypothetical protein